MREQLLELLGLPADATDEMIIQEITTLKRVANSPKGQAEKAIREKMGAGLSREDAIQVLKDQAQDDDMRLDRDEAEAEAKAKAAKVAKAPAGDGK